MNLLTNIVSGFNSRGSAPTAKPPRANPTPPPVAPAPVAAPTTPVADDSAAVTSKQPANSGIETQTVALVVGQDQPTTSVTNTTPVSSGLPDAQAASPAAETVAPVMKLAAGEASTVRLIGLPEFDAVRLQVAAPRRAATAALLEDQVALQSQVAPSSRAEPAQTVTKETLQVPGSMIDAASVNSRAVDRLMTEQGQSTQQRILRSIG